MKRIYNSPAVRYIDMEAEQMIAASIGVNNSIEVDANDAFTQKQDPDMWGNESVWK